MATNLTRRADRPNLPNGCVDSLGDLDAMSAVELAEALEYALDAMTEEDYDEAVIDAYLDALDRKAPMPEIPDAAAAHADFQQKLRDLQPNAAPLAARTSAKPLSRFLRVGLIAAVAILLMLGSMITVQAAGIDVFGAFARWTESVFSYGKIRDSNPGDTTDAPIENSKELISGQQMEYTSLQEALDDYGVTEVAAPAWFPDGYVLTDISIVSFEKTDYFTLSASYKNDGGLLIIEIMRYSDEPAQQVEKVDTIVESVDINGITFHFIENTDNHTVAWVTEHYECYIWGPYNMDIDVLREMVYSMFD